MTVNVKPIYTFVKETFQVVDFPGAVSPEEVASKLEAILPSKYVSWKSWAKSGQFLGHILCDQETGKEYFSRLVTRKNGIERVQLTVVDRLRGKFGQ